MYHLVVAFLKLSIDINILDIKLGKMLEYIIIEPSLNHLNSLLILFCGYVFNFNL